MPRKSTGTVKWMRNVVTGEWQWHARWSKGKGKKRTKYIGLTGNIPQWDREGALARAAQWAPEARASADRAGRPETVREWFGRLHKAKDAKGLATVKDMRGRAERWVFPIFGDKDMRAVTREDGERLVYKLDFAIVAFQKDGPGQGRLSPSTAANVWGDVQHAFDEAVNAKDASLRVLETNPLADVRGPEAGEERQGQILYSDELVALLRGEPADNVGLGVPLYRRRTYAMAVYTKARASELEALKPEDVDLAHHTITISKQVDRESKGRSATKKTKTKRVRTVDIEPNLLPLIKALVEHPQGKGRRLLHMPPPEDRAELLRKDLETVGVTRKALHVEGDPLVRGITFHDLRDTGLTHMAVRGDSPIAIQWAGGHTDFKTTQGYIDRGRVEAKRIGDPLPPLPRTIACELPRGNSEPTKRPKIRRSVATPTGIEAAAENAETPGKQADPSFATAIELPRLDVSENASSEKNATAERESALYPMAEIEAAIRRLARALSTVGDEQIPAIVAERASLRAELRQLRETGAGNVVRLPHARKGG